MCFQSLADMAATLYVVAQFSYRPASVDVHSVCQSKATVHTVRRVVIRMQQAAGLRRMTAGADQGRRNAALFCVACDDAPSLRMDIYAATVRRLQDRRPAFVKRGGVCSAPALSSPWRTSSCSGQKNDVESSREARTMAKKLGLIPPIRTAR